MTVDDDLSFLEQASFLDSPLFGGGSLAVAAEALASSGLMHFRLPFTLTA